MAPDDKKPADPGWRVVKLEKSKIGMKLDGGKSVPVVAPTERFLVVYLTVPFLGKASLYDKDNKVIAQDGFVNPVGPGQKVIYFESEFPKLEELTLDYGGKRGPLMAAKGKKP
jgi:hypothetical protein